MRVMNNSQATIILLFAICVIAFAFVFRVFILPKLPVKFVKILQAVAVVCGAIAILFTGYTIFFIRENIGSINLKIGAVARRKI
ncbi:MAG: hypothetical protein II073_02465 [Lachnospiraceae bacterium]|nr:hypothetical protein [Lachnospiraceae bacterium]